MAEWGGLGGLQPTLTRHPRPEGPGSSPGLARPTSALMHTTPHGKNLATAAT